MSLTWLVLAWLIAATAHAQPAAEEPVIARVTVETPAEVQRFIALGLDVLEAREGDDLFVLTTASGVARLRADGWKVAVDLRQTRRLRRQQHEQRQRSLAPRAPQPELFMGGYRTVSEARAFLDAEAVQYPNLAEVFVYGDSWERVTGGATAGHDLFGISLTNKQRSGPKPTLFLMAAIHARELSTSELALRFVDYLLSRYGIDGDATWLLDEHLIVVVPMANPDGRVLAEQGYLQRKNTDTSYGQCSIPNIGVDLNRNSSFKWGTVNRPTQGVCTETYPGPVAVSEPETAALQSLIASLFPDQRGPGDTDPSPITTTGVLISLHSYSNLVLWPWGWTSTPAPNATDLSAIGRKFASYNGYTPQQSIDLYPTSGTTDDWAYGELGIAAFTFEVGPSSGTCGGFFPSFSCLDGGTGGAFWPRNLPAFLYGARIARTPFQLAQGPTPEALTASVLADGTVTLEARLDEQHNGGQSIAAAEYYLDTPPWLGGSPSPMTAADGSFDGVVEVAVSALGPLTERHLVFVRGQDATGAWGPVRAVFTPDPACLATLAPASASFSSTGGTGTIDITVAGGCGWTADTVATWITIMGTSAAAGVGSVDYTVAANGGASSRTATIVIAGQQVTLTQDGQTQAARPDLATTALSDPPVAVTPGTSFAVTDTVTNLGQVAAAASTVRYYLSTDAAKGSGDKLLAAKRSVPALSAGASSTGHVTVTIPASTALGSYYLLSCADGMSVVVEASETNNCMASGSPIQVTRPDLTPTAISEPPASAARGTAFPMTDTVTNRGIVGSSASTNRYYLSKDRQKSTGDKVLTATRSVPSLAAGDSSSGGVTVTVPAAISVATYYVIVCADAKGAVAELDEHNNCLASSTPVTVTP